MRAAARSTAAALAAAVLAACTGDVDGAPCSVPGATTDCPGGQACGNDRRCSARALACAPGRCTPGVGGFCTPEGEASHCVATDRVCGAWIVEPCADLGMVCGVRSGDGACECPADTSAAARAGRTLTVRPEGGAPEALPFATGAASPPACAFRTLGAALSRAADVVATDPSDPVTIVAAGGPTFSAAAGERFPIVVPRGVRLRSEPVGAAAILFDAASATSAAVELRGGSALEGLVLRNGDRGAAEAGVEVVCAAGADPVQLTSVVIAAAGARGARLGTGLRAAGACAVLARGLEVAGAGTAGILWEPRGAPTLAVAGGAVTAGAGAGVVARGGALRLEGVRVAENLGRGLDVSGGGRVELRGSRLVRNLDGGAVLSDAAELRLVGNTLWSNGAKTQYGGSPDRARRGGGLVLSGTPPAAGALELRANRIYGNEGDQVLVVGPATATWNLDGGACTDAQLASTVGCYDPSASTGGLPWAGVVAVDAGVSARGWWWSAGTPRSGVDALRLPSGTVDVTSPCTSSSPVLACDSEDPAP
jgi:hypothetical protein